jgi:chromosome segregation ATPase
MGAFGSVAIGRFSQTNCNLHGYKHVTCFERIGVLTVNSPVAVIPAQASAPQMPHWTDDPRLHGLMTHLGKTGKTGKPTRGAFVAEQVSQIMIKIEPMVSKRTAVVKELNALHASLDKKEDLIANKKRHAEGIKIEFDQAKEDILSQNPNADVDAFNADLRFAMTDLEAEFQKALTEVDPIKQTIRVKRTTMRGLEDRMEMYHKQVQKHMSQLMKSIQSKSA